MDIMRFKNKCQMKHWFKIKSRILSPAVKEGYVVGDFDSEFCRSNLTKNF